MQNRFAPVAKDTPKLCLGVAPLNFRGELRVPRPNLFGRVGPEAFRKKNRLAAVALLAAITLSWGATQGAAPPRAGKEGPRAPNAAVRPAQAGLGEAKAAEDDLAARRVLKRADDLLLAGEAERAVKILESVVEQSPASKAALEAWLALGRYYVGAADYPKALNALRHLTTVKGSEPSAASGQGEEPTGRDLDIYLEALYLTGVANFQTRQFATAFPLLRKITSRYPNTVWANQAHYYIGMCHFAQGNWNKAIESLTLVGTFVDPSSPTIEVAEAGRRFYVKVQDTDLPVLYRLGKKPTITLETLHGDKETLACIPLAAEAGIFIAAIPTDIAVAKPGDGILQVFGGDTITARYVDDNAKDGSKAVTRERKVRVVSTATLRFTLGTYEAKATAAFLGQPLFVLLHDVDLDTTPNADTATVRLTSGSRRPREDAPPGDGLAAALEAKGDDEDRFVVRDEVLLTLTEQRPVDGGQRTVDSGQPVLPNPQPPTPNTQHPVHTGRFGGSVAIEPAREGQPIDKADQTLTCATNDEIVATYVDELHIGGEAPRQVVATIRVIGEIDGHPRATQNVVPDAILRTKKNLVEATAYLELARIFRSMGLVKGAKEKALEGVERVSAILGDRTPIPSALREEAFKLKWELHIVQDDYPNAIATCRLFNRLYPDSPFVDQALMGIGTIHLDNKQYGEAIGVYRQILDLPASGAKAEAQFRIAEATEAIAAAIPVPEGKGRSPRAEAAIQQYKLCAERFPESEFAGRSLAKLIDYYVEQKDYARAEDLLDQVFQDYPDSPFLDSMLLKWVLVAYLRGDYPKAHAKCSQLIFEYPASEHAKKAKELLPKIEEKVNASETPQKKEG